MLFAAGLVLAAISGASDGAALVALAIPARVVPAIVALLILVVAIAFVPLLVGTAVATTLAEGLVPLSAVRDGGAIMRVAVATALTVVFLLSRRGLPSSMTVALVGATVGAAMAWGEPIAWPTVARVAGIGLLAPLVSAALGLLALRVLGRLSGSRRIGRSLSIVGVPAFVAQAVAYAANDAQRMTAVLAVADGSGRVVARLDHQIAIAALFGVGVLAGIVRIAQRLTRQVMLVRPAHAVSSEGASALVVLASAAGGIPVSMTQAVTASVIGAGIAEAPHRIRWREPIRIAAAWLFAPVLAGLVGAAAAGIVR